MVVAVAVIAVVCLLPVNSFPPHSGLHQTGEARRGEGGGQDSRKEGGEGRAHGNKVEEKRSF